MDTPVDAICNLLQTTWDVTELAALIKAHFPQATRADANAVADLIADIHCSGNGYDVSDIECALAGLQAGEQLDDF